MGTALAPLLCSLALAVLSARTHAFTITSPRLSRGRVLEPTFVRQRLLRSFEIKDGSNPNHKPTSTSLSMSKGKVVQAAGQVAVLILFFVGFLAPAITPTKNESQNSGKAPVVSVATKRQDFSSSGVNDALRLSRGAIQEKLSSVPVFYLRDEKGTMSTDIFTSYADAKEAASKAAGSTVCVSTLDQVEYPLILNRGRMKMAPPPIEVAKAEATLSEGGETYRLVPSKQALQDAREFNIELGENNFPLFAADRLAFATPTGGIQVPMFMEKRDVITSYERLRSTKQNLPEQPVIRPTTLNDELFSMERGTRPGMSQLAIYATAEDVNQAVEIYNGR